MRNAQWANDHSPIDSNSTAKTSRYYSKAYLRHLFHVEELLAGQIATLHNLAFYLWLVKTAREKILDETFNTWQQAMLAKVGVRL